MDTSYYVLDPNAVILEFGTATGEEVTYIARLWVVFQLNLFGRQFRISTGEVAVQGVHNFRGGADAFENGQGVGNQNSDKTLD